MRRLEILLSMAVLATVARPAVAEPRWLACKYTDIAGKTQTFHMVFDDLRNTASIFDDETGTLVEGTSTSTTFQAVRTRFPQFILTYNRNNGGLSVAPTAGGLGGILTGECRRSLPPPGAPAG